jgi:hypothetical protein
VFDGVLDLGDEVIEISRSVLDTDPDPLTNVVTLTCSPEGFPNVLVVSDTHSVELFQPAVVVTKTGPVTATSGTIIYDFTISNLSSADSPNLILDTVTDTVLGDLTATASANGCSTLAFSGSCSFSFGYTIKPTDTSPLTNVVTVHYHPDGFPNDVTDDDDHVVELPGEFWGFTPGFWKNHTADAPSGHNAWKYTEYTPTMTLGSVFTIPLCIDGDLASKELLDALEFKGGRGEEGASRILLRAGVAALLNASFSENMVPDPAAGGPYPYTVDDVIDLVSDALASCDRITMITLAKELDDANNDGIDDIDWTWPAP